MALLLILCLATAALAETPLVEFEEAPFPVAIERHMQLRLLPVEDQAGYHMADVLPPTTVSMDLVELTWPKSKNTAVIGVAQSTGGIGAEQQLRSHVCLLIPGGEAQLLPLDEFSESGFVARMCAWPTAVSSDADLIVVLSFSWGWQDSAVLAYRVAPDGSFRQVDTAGASTLYGWFDVRDLDDDGSFELVTSRNLDGTIGGFFYHAVRSFNAATDSYGAQPEQYREFFENELAWLDWVVTTREAIQADPEPFLDTTGVGPVYRAEYNGTIYGFDSVVEVPRLPQDEAHVTDYNNERRAAFALVREYRDGLRSWLAGGEYPQAWRLGQ